MVSNRYVYEPIKAHIFVLYAILLAYVKKK